MNRRARAAVLALAVVLPLIPAAAASAHTVPVVSGYTVNVRTGPGTSYPAIGTVTGGQRVAIACTVRGQTVTGPYGATDVWDYIHLEGYVSDAFLFTGQSGPVGPACGGAALHWDTPSMNAAPVASDHV